jgi:ribosomal protein L25 (general stress protein Ctc)
MILQQIKMNNIVLYTSLRYHSSILTCTTLIKTTTRNNNNNSLSCKKLLTTATPTTSNPPSTIDTNSKKNISSSSSSTTTDQTTQPNNNSNKQTIKHPITHGELICFPRVVEGTRNCHKLRKIGLIPGVVYGKNLNKPWLIQLFESDIVAALRDREGSFGNSIYKIRMENSSSSDQQQHQQQETAKSSSSPLTTTTSSYQYVIPRNLQIHPVTRDVVSLNFLVYDPEEGALVDLPVLLTDEEKCPGVKRGGVLNQIMLNIRCLVRGVKIPASLHLSVEGLQVGQKATWKKSIVLPPKDECEITLKVSHKLLKSDPDLTLLTIQGTRATKDAAKKVDGDTSTTAATSGGGSAEALDKF